MKTLFSVLLVAMALSTAHADLLEDLKGEKRVLLLDFPEGSAYNLSILERQIQRSRKQISDRDLVLYHIGDIGLDGRRYSEVMSEEDRLAIREKLKLGERSELPMAILLDKDGAMLGAQKKRFGLTALLKKIDEVEAEKAAGAEE